MAGAKGSREPGTSPEGAAGREGADEEAAGRGARAEGWSETEATLAIRAEDPERIAGEIAGLERIGGRPLRPGGDARFRDTYFDTPGGVLGRRGAALRIRRSESGTLLGLKMGGRPLAGGGIERREWEGEWSDALLADLLELLEGLGVELPRSASVDPGPDAGTTDPEEVLRGLGLRVIQDRETRRRESAVLSPDGERTEGVLAVDAVEFRTAGGRAVTHHEVEIEAGRCADPGGLAREVAAALRERYPESLVAWDHSKLATGRAVERASAAESPGRVAGPEGRIRPGAYELIRERIADDPHREEGGAA